MGNDEFISIPHHLSRHFLKSCAPVIPFVSFVFVTPKVSSISNDSFTLITTWVGIVHLISYRGRVGCGSACMSSCFRLLRGPPTRAPLICHGARRWARLWGVCLYYCAGSCARLKALCTRSLHRFCSSLNNCSCIRNIGGSLVLITS